MGLEVLGSELFPPGGNAVIDTVEIHASIISWDEFILISGKSIPPSRSCSMIIHHICMFQERVCLLD